MKKVILASSFVVVCAGFFAVGLYSGGFFKAQDQDEEAYYPVSRVMEESTQGSVHADEEIAEEPQEFTPQPSTATLDDAAIIGMCTHVMRGFPYLYSEFIMPLYKAQGNTNYDQRALARDIALLEHAHNIAMNSLGQISAFAMSHDEAYRKRFYEVAGNQEMGQNLRNTMPRTAKAWVDAINTCYSEVR